MDRAADRKTVLITGASQGIGAAIAEKFAGAGYNVAINYRSHEKAAAELAKRLEKFGGIMTVKADVSKPDEIDEMFKAVLARFGRLDVFVSNAGIHLGGPFTDTPLEQMRREVDTNLIGAMYCAKLALGSFTGGGSIVMVTSIDGLVGLENCAVYSATKGGLHAFVKAIAKEYGGRGVRINAVAPGAIATPMTSGLTERPEVCKALFSKSPIARIGKPAEIAETVLFLAGEGASYITGQVIAVDGGITLPYGGI